ncbi:OmpA family protein [Chitinophaga filiformis]|uniref:OmpA family protein n=1 Tax=Chitinophaga filiformis TaxID=104663 RepID=UPI001F2DF506|nr:OmpA family protein [Chitinophaga filiformis]MCF6402694.1 OmpA family protein [Chitinophaga filiformis]MCF6403388.1 OmpA family protein [Chitinophaga filiformis]
MKNTSLIRAACVLALSTPLCSIAQTTVNGPIFTNGPGYKRWSVGVNGGLLAPVAPTGGSNDFTKWKAKVGYGAYVKWQILHSLGIRADFIGGKLAGNNDRKLGNEKEPNRRLNSFETNLKWSTSLNAVINLATINWMYRKNALQIYVSGGAGLAGYSPKVSRQMEGGLTEYKPNGSITEFYVPIGAGLKFKLTEAINLDLGYTMHYVDGDNLDGFYLGQNKDKYSYGYAGVEFPLGPKNKPQLNWQNPAKVMYDELQAQKANLQRELETSRAENNRLTGEVNKLTADADADGVSDYFDKCPGTASGNKVDGSGCELPKATEPKVPTQVVITDEDRRIVRNAIQDLEFETGKSSIKPGSYGALNQLAELLRNRGFSLKLGGHTDNVGNSTKNMALSKDRAESVKQYLVDQGANPSKIEAVGYGSTQPVASNKTKAGRQKNRRVEFTIY